MNIGQSIFGSYDKNIAEQNVNASRSANVRQPDSVNAQPETAGLKEGAVFKGEILDIAGDKVTIALDNNTTMPARLQGDVALTVGDILLFSVKEKGENQILIKPMFDSLYSAETQTLERILDTAGLSPTEKNFSAAKELMEAGMPVDKGSLVKLLSQSMKFEGTSMETLVALNKLNVPVTEESIAQFERYQNYNHQLTGDIKETAESMADFAKAFPAGTEGNTLVSVANEILDIILPGETGEASGAIKEAAGEEAEALAEALDEGMTADDEEAVALKDGVENSGQVAAKAGEQNPEISKEQPVNQTKNPENAVKASEDETGKQAGQVQGENTSVKGTETQNELSKSFMENVSNTLQKAGIPDEQVRTMLNNSNSPEELLKQMTQALNGLNGNETAIRSILESAEYKKLMGDVIKNSWSMNPKSMKDSKEIDELYDKITRQSKAFEEAISAKGGDTSEFNQNSQNMRQNMEFIENLNQQMIYAQMPLKLSNQNANSELFVYADKRKLAQKKDGISVMLHLDMDNLGKTDIKVTLTGTNVNARFYLNDQESVDIVADNMNELAKQLADRGFSLTNEVIKREPAKSVNQVVDEIIDENAEKSIKRYTFDART